MNRQSVRQTYSDVNYMFLWYNYMVLFAAMSEKARRMIGDES